VGKVQKDGMPKKEKDNNNQKICKHVPNKESNTPSRSGDTFVSPQAYHPLFVWWAVHLYILRPQSNNTATSMRGNRGI